MWTVTQGGECRILLKEKYNHPQHPGLDSPSKQSGQKVAHRRSVATDEIPEPAGDSEGTRVKPLQGGGLGQFLSTQ